MCDYPEDLACQISDNYHTQLVFFVTESFFLVAPVFSIRLSGYSKKLTYRVFTLKVQKVDY